jgi:hypothetical protein
MMVRNKLPNLKLEAVTNVSWPGLLYTAGSVIVEPWTDYNSSALGTMVRHQYSVTHTVTSLLGMYDNVFSTWLRHSYASEKFKMHIGLVPYDTVNRNKVSIR